MLKKYYEQSAAVNALDTRCYYVPFGKAEDAFGCRKKATASSTSTASG